MLAVSTMETKGTDLFQFVLIFQCEYDDIGLPCTVCSQKGLDCDIEQKVLPQKSICNRCEKAPWKYHYPQALRARDKEEKIEKRQASSGSESSLNFDVSDDEPEKTVAQFSSSSGDSSEYFSSLIHVEQLKETLI